MFSDEDCCSIGEEGSARRREVGKRIRVCEVVREEGKERAHSSLCYCSIKGTFCLEPSSLQSSFQSTAHMYYTAAQYDVLMYTHCSHTHAEHTHATISIYIHT